ncbi:MAG: phosphatase PAP2 family protein [bacterium]|nr:phosphatase PAP2 family protein [bacterium]
MFRAFAHRFPQRFLAVYRGNSIFHHIAAVVLTYVLVVSGFDWYFFEVTRSPYFYPLTMAAGIGGFFVPVLVPIGMYVVGEIRKNTSLIAHGALCAQAVAIAWVVSSFYKALTGRVEPEFLTQTSFVDGSRDFNFGILEHGIFWGWPSSHTTTACALAAALIVCYSGNRVVKALAFLFAVIVAAGAAVGFHWFSDVLAGVIIGTLVGVVVARAK